MENLFIKKVCTIAASANEAVHGSYLRSAAIHERAHTEQTAQN